MNKQQLITALCDKAGLHKDDALYLVDVLEQTMRKQLSQDRVFSYLPRGKLKLRGRTTPDNRSGKCSTSLAIPIALKEAFPPGKAMNRESLPNSGNKPAVKTDRLRKLF